MALLSSLTLVGYAMIWQSEVELIKNIYRKSSYLIFAKIFFPSWEKWLDLINTSSKEFFLTCKKIKQEIVKRYKKMKVSKMKYDMY